MKQSCPERFKQFAKLSRRIYFSAHKILPCHKVSLKSCSREVRQSLRIQHTLTLQLVPTSCLAGQRKIKKRFIPKYFAGITGQVSMIPKLLRSSAHSQTGVPCHLPKLPVRTGTGRPPSKTSPATRHITICCSWTVSRTWTNTAMVTPCRLVRKRSVTHWKHHADHAFFFCSLKPSDPYKLNR